MNKKILFAVIGVAALGAVTSGCQKKEGEANNNSQNAVEPTKAQEDKKLNCTLTETEDKYTQDVKYTFNFKGDDYNKVTVVSTTKYKSGKYDEKTADKYADECNNALKDAKGFTCNVQRSGASIYVTYQFTIADLNDVGKKNAEEAGLKELEGKKYDDVKSSLTAGGFTCE